MRATTKWLSTNQAANELGVTVRTVYRFLDEGDLPGYRFGRVLRIKAADVEAFAEAHRVKPGALSHLYPPPAEPSGPVKLARSASGAIRQSRPPSRSPR